MFLVKTMCQVKIFHKTIKVVGKKNRFYLSFLLKKAGTIVSIEYLITSSVKDRF